MTQQYQVLARKYRPKNFHELIGQTHVSQALINAIDYNRLHHAYLFTGTRGVGKTTIARILSKCLNCDTGVTSTPCGVCDNCVAIDQGRFIDLIEIDAASRTKVEDTRELLDNVPYAPSQGRYKVYLIDEVHMLSTHSFNALLKTLEEPPEHVKFLLATTDPQKLPITIISRCLQFVLRPLPQTLLSEHLANILTQEQVDYTQPALWQLASAAKGSVRDALSLTDQAIAFGQGALDDVTVNAMLGLIDAADLVRLITDIYNHDKAAVAAHIEQMRAQMVDASSMFDGLAELLHQLALTQLLPEVALNVNETQAATINKLANHISPDVLQLYYEIVVQAREGIKLASTPMQALEMCILRLLAFRPLPVDEIVVPQSNQESTVANNAISAIEHVGSDPELQAYDIDYQASNKPIEDEGVSISHESIADSADNLMSSHLESIDTPEGIDVLDDVVALDNVSALQDINVSEDTNALEKIIVPQDSHFLQQSVVDTDIENAVINNIDDDISDTDIVNEIVIDNSASADRLDDLAQDIELENGNNFALEAMPEFAPVIESNLSIESEQIAESVLGIALEPSIHSEPIVQVETIIESQPVTTAKSDPIHQPAVEPELATEPSQNNSHDVALTVEDPRTLLRCPPQSLTGEWSAEKWDYWLQTAREQDRLAEDERALARQGMMTGLCNGEATFITNVDSKHLQATFEQLAAKLQQQFAQADISLLIDKSVSEIKDKTPESRQNIRLEQASAMAQELLLASPVMRYLSEREEGKMGKIKLI